MGLKYSIKILTTSFYFASLLSDLFTTTGIKGKVQSNLGKQATSIQILSSTVQPISMVQPLACGTVLAISHEYLK